VTADGRGPLPPHLDPRAGRGAAGERSQQVVAASGRRTPRAVVLGRAVGALLSLAILAGSGWGWYLVQVAQASVSRTDAIPTTGNSDVNGADHAGKEMNLLLVGMDSREGLTAEQQAEYVTGDPDGVLNTDTMMLVHIPADGSAASFVSFPRDMYVSIPGHGKGKLNSAYAFGSHGTEGTAAEKDAAGAQLLIKTISQLSGLQIDHFAEVDLLGFINLSNIVGGVQVNLCRPTYDDMTGARFPAGVQTLSGSQALLFVRQRHGLPRYDLDRVVRQQVYIAGMLRNVLSSNLLFNPAKQRQVVRQVGSSVTFDQGLDLFDLAAQMQSVRLENITFQTIPGLTDAKVPDWGDVLQLPSQQTLHRFFASLTATPASGSSGAPDPAAGTVSPGSVTVSVVNGSGRTGAAAAAATALTSAGFGASADGNASHSDSTTVRFPAGEDAAARAVAAHVPGAALAEDSSLPAGTVRLVIGADFNGIGQPVTTQEPTSQGGYAAPQRTASDTACIA
jgi:LCP family protein required for cell wall assembly